MAIDLTKQRLFSLRLSVPDDNRYHYGAFNAYYDNQVFYASIREDITDGIIYYSNEKTGAETDINVSDMVWFVSYLYYDANKLLDTNLSRMELIEDITDYSKSLSDLPTVPDGYILKWNIYGVVSYSSARASGGTYLKDDLVYATIDSGTSYQIYKANTNAPGILSSGDWDPVFDVTLNDLYLGIYMYDFVYDMLLNPDWQVPGDFIEGDKIAFIPEEEFVDDGLASTPFLKYSCNGYRIYLEDLQFTGESPDSNVVMRIQEIGTDGITTNLYILADSLDDNGYYDFNIENDGIYIVTIYYNDEIFAQDYLIVTCSMETCLFSLMEEIYCNDLDCCNNCDEDTIKQMEFRRNELNKLTLFVNMISAVVNYAKINYTGTVMLDTELYNNMEKASRWFEKVDDIVSRCGTCNENISNSNNCTQC